MITAQEARNFAKSALPSKTDRIFLESVYKKIEKAAKEGQFSIFISFNDLECENTTWIANNLKEQGFCIDIKEPDIDEENGYALYTGTISWD